MSSYNFPKAHLSKILKEEKIYFGNTFLSMNLTFGRNWPFV